MLNQYITIERDEYFDYNHYLPQQRIHITIHVQFNLKRLDGNVPANSRSQF